MPSPGSELGASRTAAGRATDYATEAGSSLEVMILASHHRDPSLIFVGALTFAIITHVGYCIWPTGFLRELPVAHISFKHCSTIGSHSIVTI